MLLATDGIAAPAATATNPAMINVNDVPHLHRHKQPFTRPRPMGVSGLDLPPSGVCDRGNGFTVGITIPLQIVGLNHLSDTFAIVLRPLLLPTLSFTLNRS